MRTSVTVGNGNAFPRTRERAHRIKFIYILFFKLCFIKSQINGVNLNSLLCRNYGRPNGTGDHRNNNKKTRRINLFTIFGEQFYGYNFSQTGLDRILYLIIISYGTDGTLSRACGLWMRELWRKWLVFCSPNGPSEAFYQR